MSTYQTTGLVLSSQDFREADKIFSIYTRTRGKIEALACGVRKIKSKLRAHLEPFSLVNLMLAHGRRHDRLIGAITEKNYRKIKSNYQLSIINYQLLEIVDQLTKHHHPDKRIFDLLVQIFDYLENKKTMKQCHPLGGQPLADNNVTIKQLDNSYSNFSVENHHKNLLSYFILNFLAILGYTPELNLCIRCKSPVSNATFFSFRDGSVICSNCVHNDTPISPQTLLVLKKYLVQNFAACYNFGTPDSRHLINKFLNYHLDRPLKSTIINKI